MKRVTDFAHPAPYLLLLLLALTACAERDIQTEDDAVRIDSFGQLPDGRDVEQYTVTNARGVEMAVITYGGIITSLRVPDAQGNVADIVLGYDDLASYLAENPYFGALIGRYGNRIADGQFELDGETYTLATNDGPNHLHGGVQGFDKVLWEGVPFQDESGAGVILSYTSPDGEEGYPGTLDVTVTYTLTDSNELIFDYQATTDQATPVNLTQHSYFNLAGHDAGDILDHELLISAESFTPVDATLIPTGERRPVADTPFDFRAATPIGARIGDDDQQLRFGIGYDHNFVLSRTDSADDSLALAARVTEPESGRVMEVYTTEPGLQFYSGNFLDGSLHGKGGVPYEQRSGFCLETQHFPDSPNQPDFPSTIVRPDAQYQTRTVYRFTTTEG